MSGSAWQDSTFSLLIIDASGAFTGLFTYSPVPGAGNLIASIAAAGGTDPYGNTFYGGMSVYDSAGNVVELAAGTAFFFNQVSGAWFATISPQGELVYGGVPAPGNLVASIAAQAGTDSHGNNISAGIVSYSSTNPDVQVNGGVIQFLDATFSGGGLVLASTGGGGQLLLDSPNHGTATTAAALALFSHATTPGVVAGTGLGDQSRLTTALLEVQGTAAISGAVTATGGTASAPTLITTDTWHSLGALGAHYTVTFGRYRLTPDNEVELDIKVTGDGLQATSVSFANSLPAAYQPTTTHDTLPMGTSRQVTAGDIWPRLGVSAGGVVTVTNQGTANVFACCVRVPLD